MKSSVITIKFDMNISTGKNTINYNLNFDRDPAVEIDYATEDKLFRKFDATLDSMKDQIRKLAE